jgi:hypothetical protein
MNYELRYLTPVKRQLLRFVLVCKWKREVYCTYCSFIYILGKEGGMVRICVIYIIVSDIGY